MDRDKSRSWQVQALSTAQAGIALAALLAFLALHNAWWLSRDVVNPLWDEAVYLLKSLEAFETMHNEGAAAFSTLYYQSMGVRPTFFFVLLTLPFYALFGTAADVAILGTNTIVYALVLLATFLLGRHLFDARVGVLAAYVTAMIPGLSILSRLYWPHFTVVAVAPLGTYLLVRSAGFSRTLPTLGFGLLLGLSLMVRPVYPALFLLAPAFWVTGQALLSGVLADNADSVPRRLDWRRLGSNLVSRLLGRALLALLLVVAIAGPFYYRQLLPTLRFITFSENLSANLSSASFWGYIANLPSELSPYLCILLLIGLMMALVKYRSASAPLVFCFVLTLVLISIPSAKRTYYLPPLFPLVGILATFWIFGLRRSWLRRGVVAVTIVMSLAAFLVTAWGRPEYARSLTKKIFPLRPFDKLDRLDWRMPEIADLIHQGCGASGIPKVGFVSHDQMLLEPSFRYLARPLADQFVYARPTVYFETLVLADCVVVERQKKQIPRPGEGPLPIPLRFGRWQAVLMLQDQSSAFYSFHRSIGEVALADGRRIEVYARAEPASHDEVRQLAAEMIGLDAEEAERQIRAILRILSGLDPPLIPAFEESLREARETQGPRELPLERSR